MAGMRTKRSITHRTLFAPAVFHYISSHRGLADGRKTLNFCGAFIARAISRIGVPQTMLIADAHEQMIEQQVRAWDVLDERVLEVFRKVPREHFVPPAHRFLRVRRSGDSPSRRTTHAASERRGTAAAGPRADRARSGCSRSVRARDISRPVWRPPAHTCSRWRSFRRSRLSPAAIWHRWASAMPW